MPRSTTHGSSGRTDRFDAYESSLSQEVVMNFIARPRAVTLALVVGIGTLGWTDALADEAPDPHASCHPAATLKRATRTTAEYVVPQISLVRDDGKTVSLPAELDDGRPVVLDFVFTTCTSICPVMSRVFSGLQDKLGEQRGRVHLVSISIDPEQDTPARLTEYARKFHAGLPWRFYTGTVEASVAAQRAFDAYRGDKMDHTPVTFIRAAPGRPWVRIDGFASSDELAAELRELVATR
jgi:protein SCO1/2